MKSRDALPAKVKRDLAKKKISFYVIDAWKIAAEGIGLGSQDQHGHAGSFLQTDRCNSY